MPGQDGRERPALREGNGRDYRNNMKWFTNL